MTNYQNLKTYNGSLYGEPRFQGLEYDWEVPDNQVVASPGGVSAVHHHWTKGFYGRGNTSGDWYAGQGDRYISGDYGNMYQSGQTATQDQGYYTAAPDYQYWQNQPPPQYSLGGEQYTPALTNIRGGIYTFDSPPKSLKLTKPEIPPTLYGDGGGVENFDGDFELLDPSDEKKSPPVKETNVNNDVTSEKDNNILKSFGTIVLLILIFISFYFWARATESFVTHYVHKGVTPTWQYYLLYAVSFLVIALFIISISNAFQFSTYFR